MSDDKNKMFVTPKFRLSFPHLFKASKASKDPNAKAQYSITMLIPKEPQAGIKPFVDALTKAKTLQWGPKEKWPKGLRSPISDGDGDEHETRDGYAGHWVVKASTNEEFGKPFVVDADKNEILQESDIYAGCFARASITAGAYDNVQKGVKFYLHGVQKLGDGKPFAKRITADDAFGPVDSIADTSDEEADFLS